MVAYLQPLVSCHLITTIIKQRKKDIEKIEKYNKDEYVYNAYYKTLMI